MTVNDEPYWRKSSIDDIKAFSVPASKLPPSELQAYLARKRDDGMIGLQRVNLGTTQDRSSTLELRDGQGRVRMRSLVAANGTPEIVMLDEAGKVVKTVIPDR